jgi:hypothetical protein
VEYARVAQGCAFLVVCRLGPMIVFSRYFTEVSPRFLLLFELSKALMLTLSQWSHFFLAELNLFVPNITSSLGCDVSLRCRK